MLSCVEEFLVVFSLFELIRVELRLLQMVLSRYLEGSKGIHFMVLASILADIYTFPACLA